MNEILSRYNNSDYRFDVVVVVRLSMVAGEGGRRAEEARSLGA
jgi:hypothetical protein